MNTRSTDKRRIPVHNVLDVINGDDSDIEGYISSRGDEEENEWSPQASQQQVRS